MATPSKADIRAATNSIRNEAGHWDTQSNSMKSIAEYAKNLEMATFQSGPFAFFVSDYNLAVQQVYDRASEGAGRMREIGDTLNKVANTYDAEEAANLHQLNQLY